MKKEKITARNHCLKEFTEHTSLWSSIRNFTFEKFGVWGVWDILPYRWSMWYYDKLKPIFKPQHSRLRKAIPKQWCDISSLILNVNFEFIKTFYEEEYVDGVVDWSATEYHQEFAHWLELSYNWITTQRPQLEKQKEEAYPKSPSIDDMFEEIIDENGKKIFQFKDDGIPYEVKYGEVNRIEELIDKKDTEVLTEFIKHRDYFWT